MRVPVGGVRVQELPGASFRDVDTNADPGRLVSYLDQVMGLDGVQAYKRQSFALMEVRPGHTVLDAGCGAGDDLRELAGLVGASGRVVGIDSSETMVQQARVRCSGLPVECHLGNAYDLAFGDATFDSCRADRLFQHLDAPEQALKELVRVTRSGGCIAISDPDWGTAVVDATNREVTRKILSYRCDKQRNGWMGRQLKSLISGIGLVDVTARPFTGVMTDWALANRMLDLQTSAEQASEAGIISTSELTDWMRDMTHRAETGQFFSALTGFTVSGRKN